MTLMSRSFAIAAVGTFAIAGLVAGSGNASARSVTDCRADSRAKVISCCQEMASRHRPIWMVGTGATCGSAAACSARKGASLSLTSANSPGKRMRLCSIIPPVVLLDRDRLQHDKPQSSPNR